MSNIKVLAFEDDELHADILRINLKNMGYTNCGIFSAVSNVVKLVGSISPDVVLMDIDFKGEMDGIQAAKKIGNLFNVPLIFLSSLPTKSVIKEVNSTLPESYIVKPYSEDQLRSAIEIAIYRYQKELTSRSFQLSSLGTGDVLYVKVDRALTKIACSDIVYIEALDKYSIIHTNDSRYTILNHLGELAEKLSYGFTRVHRSFIINVQAIKNIRVNDSTIDMGLKIIPFSKMYKQDLFEQLNVL